MTIGDTLCTCMNAVFKSPLLNRLLRTPALGIRANPDTYTEWEFQSAENALTGFRPFDTIVGKSILDVGCGFGGKSVYYALHGARHVTGIDVDRDRIAAARQFAAKKCAANTRFEVEDAASLRFADEQFDLVIFSDSFEHVDDPGSVLKECWRVLKRGGRANIMFPPYGSAWGAHLFANVRIPWAQFLFSEQALVRAWKKGFESELDKGVTVYSRQNIEAVRTATAVRDLAHLNQMSIRRYEQILRGSDFTTRFFQVHTPANLFQFLANSPICREYLVTRVITVLEKQGESRTDASIMANI
jgi:ubiquinone/menaquinone biosynthesis C-methylase UbiE